MDQARGGKAESVPGQEIRDPHQKTGGKQNRPREILHPVAEAAEAKVQKRPEPAKALATHVAPDGHSKHGAAQKLTNLLTLHINQLFVILRISITRLSYSLALFL